MRSGRSRATARGPNRDRGERCDDLIAPLARSGWGVSGPLRSFANDTRGRMSIAAVAQQFCTLPPGRDVPRPRPEGDPRRPAAGRLPGPGLALATPVNARSTIGATDKMSLPQRLPRPLGSLTLQGAQRTMPTLRGQPCALPSVRVTDRACGSTGDPSSIAASGFSLFWLLLREWGARVRLLYRTASRSARFRYEPEAAMARSGISR